MEEKKEHNHKQKCSDKIEEPAVDKKPQESVEKTVQIKESEYQELVAAAGKAGEYWDKLLRLQADFENTRRRFEKDKQDFAKYANESIILELLVILDDLERALNQSEQKHEDYTAFLKGVEMILAHLYEMLKTHGVKKIEAQGKVFDPYSHEALMQVENNELPEHTVVEELQKGYLLHDRVIRTAKVKVSKKEAKG